LPLNFLSRTIRIVRSLRFLKVLIKFIFLFFCHLTKLMPVVIRRMILVEALLTKELFLAVLAVDDRHHILARVAVYNFLSIVFDYFRQSFLNQDLFYLFVSFSE
jgi:hypothetical protein